MSEYKYDVYKHEKIEVYSDYIEKYKEDLPEELARDILINLDIEFYEIESVKLNPFDNINAHILIEYTVELRKEN
ncbi:MAG: hypothetical protein JXQ76_00365 [Campylobacterales bacterium]|nr:hypothetical protein [Campylobacterales bacterium]